MPRLLKDLTISEVSSVDRGAGRGVKVLLMKRDATTATGEVEMTTAELEAAIAKAATDAAATATAAVTKTFGVELAKRDTEIAVLKMSDTHKAFYDACGDETTKKSFADMKDDERDEHMKKNPVKKAADPVEQSQITDVQKALNAKDAEITDLRKRLDARDLTDAQASFKKRAADLGLTAEGDGELMRKAYAGDKDAQTAFEKRQAEVLKGLTAQVDTTKVFSEFGTNKGASGTAYQQLLAKGEELRKSDTKLTKEQAFAKVYEDPTNIALVQAYKVEGAPYA